MKTGIELIAIERQEQIEKHGRTIENDVKTNSNSQLMQGAVALLSNNGNAEYGNMPSKWDDGLCEYMCLKSYKERLIIAGALIAAEIDRLNACEE